MKPTKGEKIFYIINYIIISLLCIVFLYPFVYVLSASLSSADAVSMGKVLLFPKEMNVGAYLQVFQMKGLVVAYSNTIFYTVVGTAVSMILSICAAYPLSKKRLRGRTFLTFMVVLTIWFQPGMIPIYLNIKNLGLIDTRTGIIIGFACAAFYIIILRTFFQSIPDSLEESAKIDGANDIIILTKIVLPLSIPSLVTIALYYAIQRWNGYFWAMVLLNDQNKIPLQVLLKKLIVEMNMVSEQINAIDTINYSKDTMIFATIIISILPIVAVYPFIQKYFVKGVMIGSVKG